MNTQSKGLAVITGASSGIGAVYADRLARRGHDLLLVGRNRRRMDKLAGRLAGETQRNIEVMTADLNDRNDVARLESSGGKLSWFTLIPMPMTAKRSSGPSTAVSTRMPPHLRLPSMRSFGQRISRSSPAASRTAVCAASPVASEIQRASAMGSEGRMRTLT